MTFLDFSRFQLLQGVLGLIWVIIAVIVGLRILLKSNKLKRRDLIGFGLTYICVSPAWWGTAIQFLSVGFFSLEIQEIAYLFIANLFIPLGLIPWIYAFSTTIIPYRRKEALAIISVIAIIWELTLIFLLISDNVHFVGELNQDNILDFSYGSIMRYFIIGGILIFLLTGAYFSYQSMKLDNPEIKWKGRFLLAGWISFAIGAALDAFIKGHTEFSLIITRVILISSAIEYYLGFFLPSKLKEILIRA